MCRWGWLGRRTQREQSCKDGKVTRVPRFSLSKGQQPRKDKKRAMNVLAGGLANHVQIPDYVTQVTSHVQPAHRPHLTPCIHSDCCNREVKQHAANTAYIAKQTARCLILRFCYLSRSSCHSLLSQLEVLLKERLDGSNVLPETIKQVRIHLSSR
jgi:hypothetical protein